MRQDTSTVRSRHLGSVLTRVIQDSGFLAQDVAEKLGWSAPRISRLLHGRGRVTPTDIATILAVCGITAGPVRDTLLELAADVKSPTWLCEHGERSPVDWPAVRELEEAAIHLVCFDGTFVPALLRANEYMDALYRADPLIPHSEISSLSHAYRERQQRVLDRSERPVVEAYFGMHLLSGSAFADAVMAEQAKHLMELSVRPTCRIRIVPEESPEGYASTPFQLMHLDGFASIVHVEHLNSTLLSQRSTTIAAYQRIVMRLDECALSVEESHAFLTETVAELDRRGGPAGPPPRYRARRHAPMTTSGDPAIAAEAAASVSMVMAVLRRARERRGWTLEDLSTRLDGIPAQTLEDFEIGTADITMLHLDKICSALDLEAAAVIREAHGGPAA